MRDSALCRKLRSRTGASITFALLLFLVCAVVGSVVLAAGSAAAGRMSQLAQSDQRFYSVNSAAGLLEDVMDGQSVRIVRTQTTEITTVNTFSESGGVVTKTAGTPTRGTPEYEDIKFQTKSDGDWADPTEDTLPLHLVRLLLGLPTDTAVCTDAEWEKEFAAAATLSDWALEAGDDLPEVTLKPSFSGSALTVQIASKDERNEDKYTLQLTFQAAVSETTETKTKQEPRTMTTTSETIKETETQTKTTVVTWTLADIQTVTKEADGNGGTPGNAP